MVVAIQRGETAAEQETNVDEDGISTLGSAKTLHILTQRQDIFQLCQWQQKQIQYYIIFS